MPSRPTLVWTEEPWPPVEPWLCVGPRTSGPEGMSSDPFFCTPPPTLDAFDLAAWEIDPPTTRTPDTPRPPTLTPLSPRPPLTRTTSLDSAPCYLPGPVLQSPFLGPPTLVFPEAPKHPLPLPSLVSVAEEAEEPEEPELVVPPPTSFGSATPPPARPERSTHMTSAECSLQMDIIVCTIEGANRYVESPDFAKHVMNLV